MRLSKNSEVKRSYLVFFSFLPLAGPPPPLEESSPAPGAIPTSVAGVDVLDLWRGWTFGGGPGDRGYMGHVHCAPTGN